MFFVHLNIQDACFYEHVSLLGYAKFDSPVSLGQLQTMPPVLRFLIDTEGDWDYWPCQTP